MNETRFGKLGRFEAKLFCYAVERIIPEKSRKKYIERFLKELSNYSNVSKKKNEPGNEGCVRELDGLDDIDFFSPEQAARVAKERWHTKYQKDNTLREKDAYIREVCRFFKLPFNF